MPGLEAGEPFAIVAKLEAHNDFRGELKDTYVEVHSLLMRQMIMSFLSLGTHAMFSLLVYDVDFFFSLKPLLLISTQG